MNPRRPVVLAAGHAAERYRLRGYDAVHLASALTLPPGTMHMAAWDEGLRCAAAIAGLGVAPVAT